MKNTSNITVIRRILCAVAHLPKEMPNYWQTFSKAQISVSELQVQVENLQYLNRAAFSTNKQLLSEICSSTQTIGVILVSNQKECEACGANLVTRSDRPRRIGLYSEFA